MSNDDRTELPTAWLIRAGRSGEREDFNLERGFASMGWGRIPDLRELSGRDELERMMQTAAPSARKKSISTWANQMWTLIDRVRVDDLIVLPRKATSQIALGVVTQEYWYNDDSEPDWRHVVSVDWQCTDVPRTAVKQDLLYSLGSALTICTITRNDGKWRLHQLLKTGADPGARSKPTFARDADADPGHTDSDATDSADQGLLVAWGGVNQPARREMRSQFFRVRVWDADDLLDAVFRNYDKLDEALQAELPLKRIWNLVED